jgi:hypothetical protein
LQFNEKLGDLNLLKCEELPAEKAEGKIVKEWRLTLAAYDTGSFVIPPLNIYYHTKGDTAKLSQTTDSLQVMVFSAGGDTLKEIHDVKPPVNVAREFADYLPYIILLVVIGLAVMVYLWWKKRKQKLSQKAEETTPETKIEPYDWAMKRLTELEAKTLWEKGFVKEYYSEVTEIVREYIEKEFFIPALESTTEELLVRMEKEEIMDLIRLRRFLTLADLVKFAKLIPGLEECKIATKEAYELIKEAHLKLVQKRARERALLVTMENGKVETINQELIPS